ncbi:hypothetical protein TgHK011_004831 [Trichoderma gracile]|nr:hypothetical protein TgHK011_004831 [Trichoderma gracile]
MVPAALCESESTKRFLARGAIVRYTTKIKGLAGPVQTHQHGMSPSCKPFCHSSICRGSASTLTPLDPQLTCTISDEILLPISTSARSRHRRSEPKLRDVVIRLLRLDGVSFATFRDGLANGQPQIMTLRVHNDPVLQIRDVRIFELKECHCNVRRVALVVIV